MSELYITYLERPEEDEYYNKYDGLNNPYIIHDGWMWHFGRFPSMQTLERFMKFAGLEMELVKTEHREKGGEYKRWSVNCELDDHNIFTNVGQLPIEAKSFTGLSNGSLVTCYLYNDGKVLHIYRPNPNYKEIYKPLSLKEHISFMIENGSC